MNYNAAPVYFKNLNGLRAIAALLVVISHVDIIKRKLGLSVSLKPYFLNLPIGSLSVTFFFVLSGFLISFLLLKEEQQHSKVNVLKFYFKRILKIWPLYFLLTLVGFTYLMYKTGNYTFNTSLICYLLVLPNFALVSNPLCFQSWSIGVEEQFYLVWPLIITKKRILPIALIIIFSFFIARTIPLIYFILHFKCPNIFTNINNFIIENRFDSMAVGAALAYFQFTNQKNYTITSKQKYCFYLLLAGCFSASQKFYFGSLHIVFSLLFAAFIFLQINGVKENSFLEGRVMKYLGKISYGIYMWHVTGIYLAIRICNLINTKINYSYFSFNIIQYLFSIVITIIISMISYKIFESYFLRLKTNFYKIEKPKKLVENIIYL